MSTIRTLIVAALSVLCFYLGTKLAEDRSKLIRQSQCTAGQSHKQMLLNREVKIPIPHAIEKVSSECIPQEVQVPEMNDGTSSVQCRHAYEMRQNLSVLHLGKATVPDDIFSFLHHPASPAKWSYFLSQTGDWHTGSVLSSPCQEIYLTRTGSRQSQPNKCVAVTVVPEGHVSMVQQSHRIGYTALNTNQYQKDFPQAYRKENNDEDLLLLPLLREMVHVFSMFRAKMGNPIDANTGKRRKLVVMVANEGVMDLLLNFMCSTDMTHIDKKNIVVFVGEERYISLIENMGANAMYHPALGSMPKHAARGYLDETFSRMMWFKTTSVFLALSAGFEVLFQDVDLVWLRDPFPYFEQLDQDILFMDDGARTPRYTPFFVNSGFYFVKYNERTLYLFEKMMKCSASEIGQTHSHQSVLIRHIAEAHHLFGLRVYVLDQKLFPSGQTYHERKKEVKKIQEKKFRPYVFHMCWTSNRVDKVIYFKDMKLWFLPGKGRARATDTCNEGRLMLQYALTSGRGPAKIRDKCCLRGNYWSREEITNTSNRLTY